MSNGTLFVDRDRELTALASFWRSGRAECIPISGRRRVGKTALLEYFAADKRVVYYRCRLQETAQQLPLLGQALAELSADPFVRAQPPTTWTGVFALIGQLCSAGRVLLVLDELPYWVARDESFPSILQNWWDAEGRRHDLMLVLCGSAVQMMERLHTGEAPLAGCITGRLRVSPFTFRDAALLLPFADPVDLMTAYGILGGIPLYLSFFRTERTLSENLLSAVVSPTARLYVEPQSVFAAHHGTYNQAQALGVLRAIANGQQSWSEITQAIDLRGAQFGRVMERLIDDLGLVRRILPATEQRESRTYRTQYQLTDNFFRFWFRFIEPNLGPIEFGNGEAVVASILGQLSDYMGLPFEEICRDWVQLAGGAGALRASVGAVGTWWSAHDQLDVVGLDPQRDIAILGECKWRNQGFTWRDLQTYLDHVNALSQAHPVRPDVQHLLFSKTTFDERVRGWAATVDARLLTPRDLIAPFA